MPTTAPTGLLDLVVVGGGLVGLATAREFLLRRPGARVVVVEAEDRVAAHQSGHNSGVVHGGLYYEPGSLKARLCVEGAAMTWAYAAEHGIAHERCGKLVVAVRRDELGRLDELERRGVANGVPGLRRVGAEEIREIEPNATGVAALHAPNTGIIDYAAVARQVASDLEAAGASVLLSTRVHSVREGVDCVVEADSPTGPVRLHARQVVTCGGLWADRLARASGADPDPRIVPFRGAYLRLHRTETPVVRGMVYPVPDPTLPFLGVHVHRTISGDVMVGPTAVLVGARDGYRLSMLRARDVAETVTWPGTWRVARRYWRTGIDEVATALSTRRHLAAARAYVPSLTPADLDGTVHAGVRAQAVGRDGALVDDFVLSRSGAVTHVRNAPSPAATSAFALARELVDRVTG
ncbi:L-2-hydroxyglutarate oxidase [Nocardioides sp. Y6]|uniref:L-2-hydroxyglutarate oxidase n=1 Tax=Nocardioides malaquae TaxID=2773426 RepID=A0ABR9RVK0_9ACTN|nr:L-2-hydroxyglutarate oxidase [Nocardioides malaquae]MBE7325589.1 L-2-hydroxyglutarate oxidase [Nocardioides malaquae]